MSELAEYFSDPLDPPKSLQLSSKFWPDDRYQYLDILREADDDIEHSRFRSLRKTLKPVTALLLPNYRRAFLSRLVYSMVYSVPFAPIRFSIKLSKEFIRANAYTGPETQAQCPARRTDELRHITEFARQLYRDYYGIDTLSSAFSIRYINARHPGAVRRMTQFGEMSDFHLDGGKDFTCIIYLSSVQRENGCFSYIDGSSEVRKSHLLRALHQVADLDMALTEPEKRSQLPLEFRGSTCIGNYLDEPKKERLCAACVDVVGEPGTGIVFNGFDTIHRGGQPLKGERTALFIATRGHINKRLKKAFYDQLAFLWL